MVYWWLLFTTEPAAQEAPPAPEIAAAPEVDLLEGTEDESGWPPPVVAPARGSVTIWTPAEAVTLSCHDRGVLARDVKGVAHFSDVPLDGCEVHIGGQRAPVQANEAYRCVPSADHLACERLFVE